MNRGRDSAPKPPRPRRGGTPGDPTTVEQAPVNAGSADPNKISLGGALAAVAPLDLLSDLVGRPVDGGSDSDLAPIHRPSSARGEVPNNLAPALTSFVGREAELDEVGGLLDDARLVTLTGPPGAGKTRLAVEIAERGLRRFEDGVWFVALAPLSEASLMLSTLAEVLGVRQATGRPLVEAVGAYLKSRHSLVVLDNFEHITPAAPDVLALLAAAPRLQLLVTSRTRLHLSAEHEYVLRPLALTPRNPKPGELTRSEAVDLFIQRAEASDSVFRLDAANQQAIDQLCRRLDGLPLAIELAAVRVKLLPILAILARLDDRLALLSGGPIDVPARHQSLRAAIAWSYELLEPSAQRLFRVLSVFRGGWTVEGAAAVCREEGLSTESVLETLASLLDASLVVRETPDSLQPRFTMLETLQAFAAERLDAEGEAHAARARHSAYCLKLLERLEPELTGTDQATALDGVAAEHDNFRAALEFLVADNPAGALRLGASMWRFWQMRGHLVEGARWLTRALEAAGDDASDDVRAGGLSAAGSLAYWRSDMAEARRYYSEALLLRRRIGDEAGLAHALFDLAFVFAPTFYPPPEDPERTAQGMRLVEEAGGLYRKAGNEVGLAKSDWLYGALLIFRDIDRARSLLANNVARFRDLKDAFWLAWSLREYGLALLGTGDPAAAADAFGEALRMFVAAQDGSGMGLLLDDLAEVALTQGDALRAARLRGAAAGMRNVTEAELSTPNVLPWEAKPVNPGGLVDERALERARDEGRQMSQAEASKYALRSEAASTPEWPEFGHARAVGEELTAGTSPLDRETVDRGSLEPGRPTAGGPAGLSAHAALNSFHREGEVWAVTFEGRTSRFRATKGLRYLAVLLAHPGREFHALDLVNSKGTTTTTPATVAEVRALGLHLDEDAMAGDGLDETAREAYRFRLRELQAELDETEEFHDPGRAERARDEIEALEGELSRAFGLGGRRRPGASAAERARQSVTKTIREALARIEAQDPVLGAHLAHSVRTGLYCSYDPDPAAASRWTV